MRIGQVVFRRKSIGRIDEQRRQKRSRRKHRHRLPERHPAVKRRNRHQQHQRIHGQQIPRQQSTAQHAVEQRIDHQQQKNSAQRHGPKRRPLLPIRILARVKQKRRTGQQHRHKHVHVRRQVQNAVPKRRHNPQWLQIGLRVVAQKLRIAEQKPRLPVVKRIPATQRQHAACQPRRLAQSTPPPLLSRPKRFIKAHRGQRQRNDDRRLLAQRRRRKPKCRRPRLPVSLWQRVHQPPQGAGGRKDVGMRQRALGKPDGIKAGQHHRPERHAGHADKPYRQPPNRQQPQRRHHQHPLPGHLGIEAGNLPPQRQIDARQRRMGIGNCGDGNQRASAEKIPRRRNVIPRLVPVVRQPQQRKVGRIKRGKDHRKDHPERERRIQPRLHFRFQAQTPAPIG